jgi:hypothetical protein
MLDRATRSIFCIVLCLVSVIAYHSSIARYCTNVLMILKVLGGSMSLCMCLYLIILLHRFGKPYSHSKVLTQLPLFIV